MGILHKNKVRNQNWWYNEWITNDAMILLVYERSSDPIIVGY
jgi:hypothetical protein